MRMATCAALAATTILAACGALGPPPGVDTAPRRELAQSEKGIIARAVSSSMYDPPAAVFQWPPFIVFQDQGTYCGLVNGKNLHGGYVGFHPFLAQIHEDASDRIVAAEFRDLSSGADEYGIDYVASSCARYGY